MLDFLPLSVNAIFQQHDLIAARVLELALAALEQGDYCPGVEAIPRLLKRRHP